MSDIVKVITSGHGTFAAIAAMIAVLAGVQTLVRPWLSKHKARLSQRARVFVREPEIGELAAWGPQREMIFHLGNNGNSTLVVTAIKLRIVEHGLCDEIRHTKVASPVRRYTYRVELRPDQYDYDVRRGLFGAQPPALQYAPGEVEEFQVIVVTRQPHWYLARVLTHWYDTQDPELTRVEESADLLLKFPREVATREPA